MEAKTGGRKAMNDCETIADIVADLRQEASDCPDIERAGIYDRYADRIEAAWKQERKACKEAVLDFCNVFTLVYPPNDGDCPALGVADCELVWAQMPYTKGETDGSK